MTGGNQSLKPLGIPIGIVVLRAVSTCSVVIPIRVSTTAAARATVAAAAAAVSTTAVTATVRHACALMLRLR